MKTRLTMIFLSSLLISVLLIACQSSSLPTSAPLAENQAPDLTDRDRDGLSGSVRAMLTDDVILVDESGQQFESQQASSVSVYDRTGKRILQTPFRVNLASGYAITQHELLFDPKGEIKTGTYAERDSRGNVIEKGRSDEKGRRPEAVIKYEFDSAGNWVKRTISRPAEKNGQQVMQPAEASYRHFIYFDPTAPPADPAPADGKPPKSPLAADETNLSAGRVLFVQKCAACHGENGKAQTEFASVMPVKPEDLTAPKVRDLSEGRIYQLISHGLKSAGMPGFKGRVSDQSLWRIALYVKQLSRLQGAADPATLAAASPSPSTSSKTAAVPTAEQRYPFKGKVVAVALETQQVTVEHEAVPGYMGAMTMPFPLKNDKVLGALKKDDRIQAILVVDSKGGWRLENVEIK